MVERSGNTIVTLGAMQQWDDLQLLKLIDDCEQSGDIGPLMNGMELLRRAGAERQLDWERDARSFARELVLAHRAGFVEWRDQSGMRVGGTDPLADSYQWLQVIWEIRVTLEGRDRARGRLIQTALPDPDEDDGRMITGLTYEEIARALADMYTENQLPRFLADSGVPDEFLATDQSAGKVDYVIGVLESLMDGGAAARRAARALIGGWLDGRHHVPPREDLRKRVVALLAQQGWHVVDGNLVIGEKTHDTAGQLTPLGRDVRLSALHPKIRQVTERLVQDNHMDAAVLEAFKAVSIQVKKLSGLELDGRALMTKAFSETNPPIVLRDLSTQTGRDLQEGFRFLFMGAVQGIRNPNAHEQFKDLSQEEGLEALAFASLLMRTLDSATFVAV